MGLTLAALGIGERCVEFLPAFVGKFFPELEGDVVVNYGLFHSLNGDVRQIAESVLSCSAEEVPVASAAALGFGVDEA
ncbi:hypothetical protein [Mycobacteroides abscessus]|uniref:hypothetical protein n=1 Tax=Mycobacteroides abscessus TaxID=36809 RepID=UPI0030DC31B0